MTAPIDAHVEMFYSGVWNDIGDDVHDGLISIKYGQPDEHGEAVPTSVSMVLDSPDGRYAPLDPRGELYGLIGRGTKLRVRIGDPQVALELPGNIESFASTPDTAVLDITSDIDVRIECEPDSWRLLPGAFLGFARKYVTTSNQRSWAWWLTEDGLLRFRWSPDGTITNAITVTSTDAIPQDSGRLALAVLLDVDNGAAGNDVSFFTADTIDGSYTQLGATVTTGGTTSIFASTSDVEVGRVGSTALPGVANDPFVGRVHAFEVRSGLAGTVVAGPDFTAQDPDTVEFDDDEGLTWTLGGQATGSDLSLRASVEVVSWRPHWDETTLDAQVAIEAAGVLHRLGQGQQALRSSLYRDLSTKDNIVAYWPMEDGEDTTSFASGIGQGPMTYYGAGDRNPAAYSGFAASQPIPEWDTLGALGKVPTYTPDADLRFLCLLHVPDGGLAGDRTLLSLHTSGTVARFNVLTNTNGDLKLAWFDSDGALISDSGNIGFDLNDRDVMFSLWLSQDGADIDWQLTTFEAGATSAGVAGATIAGRTFGRVKQITVGTGNGLSSTAIGHVTLMNGDVHSVWDLIGSSLDAWAGETAAERMIRLTGEEGLQFSVIGDPADAADVGTQDTAELLDLFSEAAEADLGILGERRDRAVLLYRGRPTLYNQTPRLELDMSDGVIVNPFDPPLDDQRIRNSVEVTRTGGSSARAIQATGPASILAPPAGVGGEYRGDVTLNLARDGQLGHHASWRLHLGTVDQHRVSSLQIDMEHHPDLQQAVLQMRAGDRITVANPPPGLPPDDLDLLAYGWSEDITPHTWHITYNTVPAAPWTVSVVDDDVLGKADTLDSSTTASFVAGTDTSMSVATNAGPLWTTAAGQFPFDIKVAGVVLTVTAISGASSPQTFTVTQTPVNGVTKTIPSGSAVALAHPAIVGL